MDSLLSYCYQRGRVSIMWGCGDRFSICILVYLRGSVILFCYWASRCSSHTITIRPQWIFTSELFHLYFLFTKYKALKALNVVEGLFKLTILPTRHRAPHGCKDVDLCVVNLYNVNVPLPFHSLANLPKSNMSSLPPAIPAPAWGLPGLELMKTLPWLPFCDTQCNDDVYNHWFLWKETLIFDIFFSQGHFSFLSRRFLVRIVRDICSLIINRVTMSFLLITTDLGLSQHWSRWRQIKQISQIGSPRSQAQEQNNRFFVQENLW